MGNWAQLDFFPRASKLEVKQAKSLLSRYRRMRAIVEDFDRQGNTGLSPKQKEMYDRFTSGTKTVERAINLITDDEVKSIIEYRYIKGVRHKITVIYFSSMHPSTVDRKINKGIESIANTLKLWEE